MQPDVKTSAPRRWRVGLAAAVVGLLAGGSVWLSGGTASAATTTVAVTVNAGQSLATVGSGLVGANVAIWDGLLADPATSTLLKNASTSFVRYPGGSYGDIYHWQTNTATGGYVAPNTDFDHYMTMVKAADAQPIVIANYGSGTAAGGRRLGQVRQRHQGLRRQVLGDRQRGLRQRPLRVRLGDRQPLRQEPAARTPRTSCSTPRR